MPAIETPPKLPPLWGNSYWWTRTGALLGLALLLTGVAMKYWVAGDHVGSCGLPNRLTNPILAIEVAAAWEDVLAMTGPCQAAHCLQSTDAPVCYHAACNQTVCPDKIQALASLQTWDRSFIVLYWLYFLYLGLINWRFCAWQRFALVTQMVGKIAALAAGVMATFGALADWREDDRILQALAQLHQISSTAPLMRHFAYDKWRFLFFAVGIAAPIFIFWPGRNNPAGVRRSAFSQALAWLTAIVSLVAAFTGVAACMTGDDSHLELASQLLALVIILAMLTLATAQYWRGGTMAALDRLAKLRGLALLTNLFAPTDVVPQTSDIDPSHTP
jgi:hypothetical protein